jgi:hypothetical protein
LDPTVCHWWGASDTREDPCSDAGFWWIAIVQFGQSNADPGALDADDHDSKSKLFAKGMARVRKWTDEAIVLL